MNDDEFNEWLGHLNAAEAWLRAAFDLMDGIEGYSSSGAYAHVAALTAIREVRRAELAVRR